MRTYSVHELHGAPIDGDGIVFVREGFSWAAFFFNWIWALWNRLWLAAVAYLGLSIGLAALIPFFGLDQLAALIISIGIQFFFAVEANDIRRWTLEARGYREIGIVSAGSEAEAELKFFGTWEGPSKPPASLRPAAPHIPMPRPGAVWPRPTNRSEEVLGLFPQAETKADH
ncbi:MAG: DUF2628 domain-containing protein [Rhizobiales bacterium]|nr:DUF2628 domain-containing protein [Hyphomicrobiales bacterium]